MKVTLEEFLVKNSEVNFFSEEDATDFYMCMNTDNLPPAMLILIEYLSKIGWYNLNMAFSTLPDIRNTNNTYIENLLDSRLDDFIFNLTNINGLEGLFGSYLLNDFFEVDPVVHTYRIKKEKEILHKISFQLLSKKDLYVHNAVKDIVLNKQILSLDNLVRNFIYLRLVESTPSLSNNSLISMVLKDYRVDYEPYLAAALKYITIHFRDDLDIFSRLNFMKIKSVYQYANFMNLQLKKNKFSKLIELLDIIDADS